MSVRTSAAGDRAVEQDTAAAAAGDAPGRVPAAVWLPPAVLTLAVCLAGIGRSALWQDELATWSAVHRTLPELVELARHRDPVLAPYYALLHLWTDLFGGSPVSLRVPSALAMAAAAAVVAVLGARLFSPAAGLTAGLLCAALPDVSRYGQEARPYALTFLLAAVCTLLLVRALERPGRLRWAAYAAAVVALGATQVSAVALVLAHGVAVTAGWRRSARGWTVATTAALVLLLPVAVVGVLSSWQLSDAARTTWPALGVLPGRLFLGPAAAVLVGAGLLAGLRRDRRALLGLAVAVVPVAVLLVLAVRMPLLQPRYLLFTLIGWLLLAAAAAVRAGRREAVALVVVVALLGLQAQGVVRAPTRSGSPDYPALARVLAERSRPGDALVVPVDRGVRFRIGLEAYRPAGPWPADALAADTPAGAGRLDSPQCPAGECLGTPPRLWVGCLRGCTNPLSSLPAEVATVIRQRNYVPERVWRTGSGGVALYVPG